MKILYAIQSTGNGHLGRAMEILPTLKRNADVDILVSKQILSFMDQHFEEVPGGGHIKVLIHRG